MILEATTLTIGYKASRQPTRVVAADLQLHLRKGELVCLLGANGTGKSTLMRTLAGIQPPLAGEILIEGDSLARLSPQALARKLSLVLTERVNVGLLSVYALVALGRYPYTQWHGGLTTQDEQVVQAALETVGALPLASRPVSELSDGERQKVMIARALAQEPRLMMLDEPTAFLDAPRRVEIMQLLHRLAQEQGCAILLSTHDIELALRTADTLWLMYEGQLHIGAPEDLVLQGHLATALASDGIRFDPQLGAFRIQREQRGTIDIIGDGLMALWTARAVERVGYRAAMGLNGNALRIVCETGWHLTHQSTTHHYDSLGALTDYLRMLDTVEPAITLSPL